MVCNSSVKSQSKLFFQYYGHYKLLNCLDLDCKYIIKSHKLIIYFMNSLY